MIDFLNYYDNMKFMENKYKSKLHGIDSNQVSSIDAATYKTRFDAFVDQYF